MATKGLIVQLYLGDAARDARVQRVGTALREAGFEVVDVDGGEAPTKRGKPRWTTRVPLASKVGDRLAGVQKTARQVALGAKAASRVMALRPRAIHAHGLDAFQAVAMAAQRNSIPVVYDTRGSELRRDRVDPGQSRLSRAAVGLGAITEEATINLAAAVITASPRMADVMKTAFGIGVPTVVSSAPPKSVIKENTPLAERLNLDADARVVAQIVRDTEDAQIAVATLQRLPESVHLALIGVGDTTEVGPRIDRIHRMRGADGDEAIHLATGAHAGIVGAGAHRRDDFDVLLNALVEYVYANVPIAGAHHKDADLLIEQYQLGRSVPADDPPALAAALTTMLRADAPATIPFASRAEFIGRYCWEVQRRALTRVYRDLL